MASEQPRPGSEHGKGFLVVPEIATFRVRGDCVALVKLKLENAVPEPQNGFTSRSNIELEMREHVEGKAPINPFIPKAHQMSMKVPFCQNFNFSPQSKVLNEPGNFLARTSIIPSSRLIIQLTHHHKEISDNRLDEKVNGAKNFNIHNLSLSSSFSFVGADWTSVREYVR